VRGHVDEQTLAAFREGLLPARKAARITAHLAACQRCAEVDAQLAAVTTILARTPAPPMPASLAARLDAALATEIARSAAAAPSAAASPDGAAFPAAAASPAGAPTTGAASPAGAPLPAGAASPAGVPGPGERAGHRDRRAAGRDTAGRRAGPGRAPWRLPLRLATAGAVVVILAGGGYAVAHVLSAGHTGTSSRSSAGATVRGATSAPSVSGRPPEAAPATPGAGVVSGLPLVASGTHYRPGQLRAQVSAVLKHYPASGRPSGAGKAGLTPSTATFPRLAACVAHVAGGKRPRLVDLAHYGGRPAAVIVAPAPGTAKLNVWVVGPGCSAQGGGLITQFSMAAPG
jgi:hypothetical protein